ncbi:hypothetical protein CA267_003760 [Alteromonas pelagimontana]|uniref:Ricin B lectin domain-containing protein n=1 Tax=Alteromonas pelagimontana TaxID=1858656 RepID=A0A6M4MBI2_9ALTE|nr:RICIN domain-containing protein [Alteromonas pelagimontana]QJR79960.1 hypothetical protein CA267_003760 [Alteromonas pelagimontana]
MKKLLWLILLTLWWQASYAEVLMEDVTSFYPRMIRLAYNGPANDSIVASFDVIGAGHIYQSTDDGQSWTQISTINETGFDNTCCSELYEVPQTMGNTTAGTLFWAVSAHNGTPPAAREIKIYKSTDQGQSWRYFSSPVSGNTGLWEAEFIIDDYGRLVMYYASEEHKGNGYNQLIAHKISTDGGQTWGNEVVDIAIADTLQRPGMPTITQLPNGDYVMAYEICGPTYNCDAFYRKSSDGVSWGSIAAIGTHIESVSGNHYSHAPTITWFDNGTANGELVVGAQVLRDAANNDIVRPYSVYMVNNNNGDGRWTERAAPLFVPSDGTNPCNSYSPQFLQRLNSNQIIHMTNKECRMYTAVGEFNQPVPNGTYRLTARHSGKALEVADCATADEANVQQWPWNGADCQRWNLTWQGDGSYSLVSANSDKALDVAACSTENGANIQQWPYSGAPCQKWRIEPVGDGFYRVVSQNSGKVLDVDACNAADGQNVQQWEWQGGECQQWKIEPVSANSIAQGTYSIVSQNSGKALDVNACSANAGANVQQWPYSGANCQRWQVTPTADGYFEILSVNSNLALDVDGCLDVRGQNIQQWNSTGANCQRWSFDEVEPGFFKIASKNGGKVLDVNACSLADGANVQLWEWLGGACQRWELNSL